MVYFSWKILTNGVMSSKISLRESLNRVDIFISFTEFVNDIAHFERTNNSCLHFIKQKISRQTSILADSFGTDTQLNSLLLWNV